MLYMNNARNEFYNAEDIFYRISPEVAFYHNLASMIPNKIDVDTLVLACKIAFKDLSRGVKEIPNFSFVVPLYVRQISTPEFAHEFRIKYFQNILGITIKDPPEIDYGYTEVEKDVIDISNKDLNEVIAALYNSSTPSIGGYTEYTPYEWTKREAKIYLKNYAEVLDDGCISLRYVLGRCMFCIISNNLLDVRGYNENNEWGLAQRIIATCPNIDKKIQANKQ